MKKVFFLACITALFFISLKLISFPVYSDELDDIGKKLGELQSALSSSQKATAPLLSQLTNLKAQLTGIENRVVFLENDIAEKKKIIEKGYKDLEKQKEIFNKTVRDYYIKNYAFSPLLIFISAQDASSVTRLIAYKKKGTDQDKILITNIALKLTDIEERKKNLESEETRLSSVKEKLASEKLQVEKVVKGAQEYQTTLSSQIAQLSAKQQDLIAQKLGRLNIPRSAGSGGSCSSDIEPFKSPGFSPAFGLFTYGVPNRVGLNQYGAFGRSKAGQGVEDILHAYYDSYELKKDYSQEITINVEGGPSLKIDDYLKHLGEMPESWGNEGGYEALKAQAIAARSYALAYTNNGQGSICGTDHCQVFLANEKGGKWNEAVEATKGWVMVQGGNPIKAWFSSTHGGYVHSSGDIGWSGTSWTKNGTDSSSSIGSFDDLKNNAYDKESPWFYCDWGARAEYNKTAWLKPDEVADIANVILLARKNSSSKSHLYQTDEANPEGTDTWDAGRVKQELGSDAFNNVSDISVSTDFGSGKTTSVTINGDGKSQNFPASEFKDWFNLRAPKNIQIVGPLYNAEKR
ncbi:MAG: hypothetical protein COX79_05430 [Candidatus Levybacteria bacterium CG_4_10_14_0_2_um_filter_36_16]|nr:MAG: hypothetical protein AUK12_04625 [Candidatus Levybacteria bacterium CG2_30_37_29]PIR79563.1 MAG: hypothetical protein COU26_00485 [Candidatus Levybacteria bacterium CG10_big_fil_rev_8_21_14_0_10_36_30]PIZ96331.1 MAG: hypothetical protein COX79_05430 [Candidatus Levybacteria bacterium CG_4_10_14_0_2_um_filter_36_16]